jgi:hypothetical protein
MTRWILGLPPCATHSNTADQLATHNRAEKQSAIRQAMLPPAAMETNTPRAMRPHETTHEAHWAPYALRVSLEHGPEPSHAETTSDVRMSLTPPHSYCDTNGE